MIPKQDNEAFRQEQLRTLRAWRLVLPDDAVFTHLTAAWLYGWWLPQLPEHVPVFAVTAADTRPRRAGLVCSRLQSRMPGIQRLDLPVDCASEVLLRCARDLALLDLVPMIDCALRRGDARVCDLVDAAHSRRPGSRRLRAALALSDARSESFWETILRIFHVVAEIEVEPQVAVVDEAGRFVARADLLVTSTQDLHEYDGGQHSDPRQRTLDLRRMRRLNEASYVRRGFTAPDLVVAPGTTMQELDRALGRSFRPERLMRWTTHLHESCLTPTGRIRLQNRWLSSRHWSQTPA
jgi:hypothetical protein